MRKRTKVSLLLVGIFGVALGVCAGVVGMGVVAQSLKLIFFDTALLSGLVGAGATIFGATNSITGLIKRRNAEKIQAKSIAKMVQHSQGNVKSKENVYKLSNTFTDSLVYSAENNQSGLIGRRGAIGETKQQTMQRNRLDAYEARRDFLNSAEGTSPRKSRYFDKKVIRAETKLDDMNDVMSPIDRRYTYTAEVVDPFNNNIYHDHRNEIMCSSAETREIFKKAILADTARTSKEYMSDFGYATTLQFASNETLKDTCVKSNAATHMEAYELLLLQEVKTEIYKSRSQEGIFPIRLKREHYVSHRRANSSNFVINNIDDLNNRIELLAGYVKGSPSVVASGKDFVDRDYAGSYFETRTFNNDVKVIDATNSNVVIDNEAVDTDGLVK